MIKLYDVKPDYIVAIKIDLINNYIGTIVSLESLAKHNCFEIINITVDEQESLTIKYADGSLKQKVLNNGYIVYYNDGNLESRTEQDLIDLGLTSNTMEIAYE